MKYDGIVIGGGHNGLICAAYMARAGLKVLVVERNEVAGGGCCTDELTLPGFKHNTHSNYHNFPNGPAYRDLELEKFGLKYVIPDVQFGMAFRSGAAIALHLDPKKSAASIARVSKRDSEKYLELHEKFAGKLRDLQFRLMYSRPMSPKDTSERIRGELGKEFLSYRELSLYEAVEKNFESEEVRVMFKIFMHALALSNVPNLGVYFPRFFMLRMGLALGGAVQVSNSLCKVIESHGGKIVTGKHVEKIIVKNGRAEGISIQGGETVFADRFVASAIDTIQTVKMAGEENFGVALSQKVNNLKWAPHSLVTIHLALNSPPNFLAAKTDPDINRALTFIFGPDNGKDLDASVHAIENGELPKRFCGNGSCNTLFDSSVAPTGKHHAFWWPSAPYELKDGGAKRWDKIGDEVADMLLAQWREFAPNLDKQNVLGRKIVSPLDISRTLLNAVRGSHQGCIGYYPEQIGYNRPTPELSHFRTPVKGLFLCGASSHTGGTITGSPGYNCANILSEDLELKRWWTPMPSPEWNG